MSNLVTRFHLLLLWVTLALTGVSFLRVPPGFVYPAHWSGTGADWLWQREPALLVAPLVQIVLLAAFFILGRKLPRQVLLQSQHVLDPALTLLMTAVASIQLGLLLTGIGSDIDWVRLTVGGLGAVLLVLGVALNGAERNAYGGLRLPWPVPVADWTLVHRTAGFCGALAGVCLLAIAWQDPGLGLLILVTPWALILPLIGAAVVTVLVR